MQGAVAQIASWIETHDRRYVCVTGVHGVMESQRDDELKRIHNESGLTTPDGMPLVWACKWARAGEVERVYGPDLMLAVCSLAAERGWRVFLYGGKAGVGETLSERLIERFPALNVCGNFSPPFRNLTEIEKTDIIRRINNADAHIVWVGLSTPKQERWMSEFRPHLLAPVLLGVGAAFDMHAGLVRQAPRFIQRSGLEWAFRLAIEPRRLWRRYLQNNPRFIWQIFRHRPYLEKTVAE